MNGNANTDLKVHNLRKPATHIQFQASNNLITASVSLKPSIQSPKQPSKLEKHSSNPRSDKADALQLGIMSTSIQKYKNLNHPTYANQNSRQRTSNELETSNKSLPSLNEYHLKPKLTEEHNLHKVQLVTPSKKDKLDRPVSQSLTPIKEAKVTKSLSTLTIPSSEGLKNQAPIHSSNFGSVDLKEALKDPSYVKSYQSFVGEHTHKLLEKDSNPHFRSTGALEIAQPISHNEKHNHRSVMEEILAATSDSPYKMDPSSVSARLRRSYKTMKKITGALGSKSKTASMHQPSSPETKDLLKRQQDREENLFSDPSSENMHINRPNRDLNKAKPIAPQFISGGFTNRVTRPKTTKNTNLIYKRDNFLGISNLTTNSIQKPSNLMPLSPKANLSSRHFRLSDSPLKSERPHHLTDRPLHDTLTALTGEHRIDFYINEKLKNNILPVEVKFVPAEPISLTEKNIVTDVNHLASNTYDDGDRRRFVKSMGTHSIVEKITFVTPSRNQILPDQSSEFSKAGLRHQGHKSLQAGSEISKQHRTLPLNTVSSFSKDLEKDESNDVYQLKMSMLSNTGATEKNPKNLGGKTDRSAFRKKDLKNKGRMNSALIGPWNQERTSTAGSMRP